MSRTTILALIQLFTRRLSAMQQSTQESFSHGVKNSKIEDWIRFKIHFSVACK